jgi:hypothetical protein
MRILTLGIAAAAAAAMLASAPVRAQNIGTLGVDTNGPIQQNGQCLHRPQPGVPDYFSYLGPCGGGRTATTARRGRSNVRGTANVSEAGGGE